MKKEKLLWKKPTCNTIKKEQINNKIVVSACSKYIGGACTTNLDYIDSFPGSKPILM